MQSVKNELEVCHLYKYDESSPSCLVSTVDRYRGPKNVAKFMSVGDNVGHKDSDGYWIITYMRKRYKAHRIVWALCHGYIDSALDIDHKDGQASNNVLSNLRLVTRAVNQRNQGKSGSTNLAGVVGVTYQKSGNKGESRGQWLAGWTTLDGELKRKSFSTGKYGGEVAFSMACEYRAKMIEELNKQGAGYTERHGTTN